MGRVRVPANAFYGPQTQRAVENFHVSGWALHPDLIHALGLAKLACAKANRDLGAFRGSRKSSLNDSQVTALIAACREVAEGKLDDQFPIDVFQTGSGTSSNMNANEVIANRAIELTGGDRFTADMTIHPNDHVNLGQSTNDTFPTAIHVAVARKTKGGLVPVLERLTEVLRQKAGAWDQITKIGRTHLTDATPLRLGQEFGGFARQSELSARRAESALHAVLELISLLTAATNVLVDQCVEGIEANPGACGRAVEQSLSMVTRLAPHIGYERAAALAKEAFMIGKTIRELCVEKKSVVARAAGKGP